MTIFSRSLRLQLILWNALTLTVLLAVLGVVTRFTARQAILNSVDQHLRERATPPPHGPPDGRHPPDENHSPDGPPPDDPQRRRPRFHRPLNNAAGERELRFFTLQGQPRDSGSGPWDPAALHAAQAGRTGFSTVMVGGESLRVLTQLTPPQGIIPPHGTVLAPGSVQARGIVQAAYPLIEVNRAMAGLDRALLLLIPVALLSAGLGGALLTARVLRPVRQITQAAAAMGDTPSARLPTQGEDEFAQMADTFNALLSRLDVSFRRQTQILDQQRRFTADASHELKSPLTVIQGTANQLSYGGLSELEVRQAAAEIAGSAAGMARLVQDLLLLARSDEGHLGQNQITVLLGEVLAQAIARTTRNGSPIRMQLADAALTICGNEDELIRLFANLLQNAAQATTPDGTITVSARRDGEDVVVTITDNGVGITPEHLAHLGERFYRTDSARTRRDGRTGLGLSICRSIVEAHHGTLTLTSTPGLETTATVRLRV